VAIRLPCINQSQKKFTAKQGCIIIGFNQIKGIKATSIETLLKQRAITPFNSLSDFLERTSLPKRDLRKFILLGCFDRIEPGRSRSTLMLHALCHGSMEQDQMLEPFTPNADNIPKLPPFSMKQRHAIERSFLSFPVSVIPLDQYTEITDSIKHIFAEDLSSFIGKSVTLFGTLLTAKTVRTKNRESMSFLTFEDSTDLYECVAFPEAYRQFATKFEYEKSYLLKGQVDEQSGAIAVHLTSMEKLVKPT